MSNAVKAPAALAENTAAYESRQAEMEKHHMGKHVVFYNCELIGAFDDFSDAAREAAERYGRGPYLIREVGADPRVHIPASVLYGRMNA